MAKQPIPVAKRLTVDGLNDMGVQAPVIIPMTVKFLPREHDAEMRIMYEIDQGVDEEDMLYLKQSFQKLCEEGHSCTTKTRWVDHPASRDSPFVKQPPEKHRTGCARTEGYYKIVKDEKISPVKTTDSSQSLSVLPQAMLDTNRTTTGAQMSRELRSEHRRNLLALGDAEFADHFKFSQLKVIETIRFLDLIRNSNLFVLAEKETPSIREIRHSCMGFVRLRANRYGRYGHRICR